MTSPATQEAPPIYSQLGSGGEKQFQDGGGADNNGEPGVRAGPCLRAAAGPRRAAPGEGGAGSGRAPEAAASGRRAGPRESGSSGAVPASGEKEEVRVRGAERSGRRAGPGGRNRGGGEPGGGAQVRSAAAAGEGPRRGAMRSR